MQLKVPGLPAVALPGRNGLVFMGGMAALAVAEVVSGPVAIALAVLPVIDANVKSGDADEAAPARRRPATSARSARGGTRRSSTAGTRRAAVSSASRNGATRTTTAARRSRRSGTASSATTA